ncbi:MAG: hypothetical protein JWP97_4200 [Labilithrix sp.]|nr:hypothetical protein [Labilithrix sp.]
MPRGGSTRSRLRSVVIAIAAALAAASGCGTRPGAHGPAALVTDDAGPLDAGVEDADAGEDASLADVSDAGEDAPLATGPCPADMALVASTDPPLRFCIDRYEASLVEVMPDGAEQPFPSHLPVDGHDVRAVSVPQVFPQGYISEVQAEDACSASGKRLCKPDEWKTACMGPARTTFPYGATRQPGVCHDTGKSAVMAVFGAAAVAASTPYAAPAAKTPSKTAPRKGSKVQPPSKTARAAQTVRPRPPRAPTPAGRSAAVAAEASKKKPRARKGPARTSARPANVDPGVWAKLNDPRLGQYEGGLARTGAHAQCVNGYGVFDMVGNLHEWVATDPQAPHGTFAGGYYLDTSINGDGCLYRTQAHAHDYHDYSTGFRCCSGAD